MSKLLAKLVIQVEQQICSGCGQTIKEGQEAVWFKKKPHFYHVQCQDIAWAERCNELEPRTEVY